MAWRRELPEMRWKGKRPALEDGRSRVVEPGTERYLEKG